MQPDDGRLSVGLVAGVDGGQCLGQPSLRLRVDGWRLRLAVRGLAQAAGVPQRAVDQGRLGQGDIAQVAPGQYQGPIERAWLLFQG
ncbi:hypothetical protein D3C71_1721300 [compost metagenome]